MFSTIMVPVDLEHTEMMEKALTVAADLATQYDATVNLVGVSQSVATKVARTPEAFAEKLAAFAAEQSQKRGLTIQSRPEISHDIRIDLDAVLSRAATAINADLIVMASHVPGLAEHVFASNAGYLASHAKMSVFVVR